MKANIGIRRRLAPLLDGDRNQLRAVPPRCCCRCPARGALLRRRDRHGRQHLAGRVRDGVRTPMQWTPDRNGAAQLRERRRTEYRRERRTFAAGIATGGAVAVAGVAALAIALMLGGHHVTGPSLVGPARGTPATTAPSTPSPHSSTPTSTPTQTPTSATPSTTPSTSTTPTPSPSTSVTTTPSVTPSASTTTTVP